MSPPVHFNPAGEVVEAFISPRQPPFIRTRRYSGRRADGIRYERRVHAHLLELFPDTYLPSPWLHFKSAGRWRWCQPDGLLFDLAHGRIIIVEVKYSHTSDAWWQVRRLYLPVLRKCFPEGLWRFEACEVVRWFDPLTHFPEPLEMAAEVDQHGDKFRVHIWKA